MSVAVMILSGGRSRRFGGVHKPGVVLGGRTVISRILGAVREATPEAGVWVVGPSDGLTKDEVISVRTVVEEPAFSGPLAGIDATVQAMGETDVTIILAGDMPLLQASHIRALVAASREAGMPAAGIDEGGNLQYLCAAWPSSLLRRRLAAIGETKDRAVRLLFSGIDVAPVEVDPTQIIDFDTPEDYERISARVEEKAVKEDW